MKTVHISEYPLHLANQPAFYAASSSFLDQVIAASEQIDSQQTVLQQICFEIVQRLTTCRLSPHQQALYLCLYTRVYNKIIYPTSSLVASYSLSAEHFIEQALLMSSCSDNAELIDLSPITQYLGTIDDKNYSQFALLSSTPPHRFAKFEKQQFFESMVNFFDTLFRALDSEKKASTSLSLFLALLLEANTRGANSQESHMLACTIFSLKAHEMFQHLPFEDLEALIEIAEEGQILQDQILRRPQSELPFSLWINQIQTRTDLDKLQKLHLQLALIPHCIPYCHPNQKYPWAMQVVSAALHNHHDLEGFVEPNLISLLGLVDIAALDTLDSAKYLAITAKLTAITQSKTSRQLFYAALIPSLFNAVEEANPNRCFTKYSTFAPLLALQPSDSPLELLKNILVNHLPTTIQEPDQQEDQILDSDLFSDTINPFIQHISTCIEMITCPVDWDTLLRNFLELQFQNNLHPNCESLLALVGIIYSFKLKIPFGTSFDSASFSLYLLPLFKNAPEQLASQLVELSEEM